MCLSPQTLATSRSFEQGVLVDRKIASMAKVQPIYAKRRRSLPKVSVSVDPPNEQAMARLELAGDSVARITPGLGAVIDVLINMELDRIEVDLTELEWSEVDDLMAVLDACRRLEKGCAEVTITGARRDHRNVIELLAPERIMPSAQ